MSPHGARSNAKYEVRLKGINMLSSMTGFASDGDELKGLSWQFEVKSVNGRGLDVRLHLPNGCEALEQPVRAAFKAHFARGNMQAGLTVRETGDSQKLVLDSALLTTLARKARILDRVQRRGAASAGAELLSMKGVQTSDKNSSEITVESECGVAILSTVNAVLTGLDAARRNEGRALFDIMTRIVSDMEAEVSDAAGTADAQPGQMMTRLKDRIEGLMGDARISEERLEQEVALMVAKADITEELDRLKAHLADAHKLLASKGATGRKLDFLSQELLREANTLGSKSASLEMTRHSLALKSLIDQFKEQAANVE